MLKRFLLFLIIFLIALPIRAGKPADFDIKVWDDNAHGKGKVFLKSYIPSGGPSDKPAVIICPGGSYFWLAEVDEGEKVGEWLSDHGIAAFVLSYRVAGKFNFVTDFRQMYGGNRYPAMLEDAQRSIRIVRNLAPEYGIDGHKVGIMGFSAGGHLAMLSEEINTEYPKPDFVAMIYPVVSLSDPKIAHRRSRRGILGDMSGKAVMRDSLSLEKHVPDNCCPVFLLHCEDDPVVNFNNSVVMDSALTAKGVRHKFIKFPRGGHGFGIKVLEADGREYHWTDDFLSWLRDTGITGESQK